MGQAWIWIHFSLVPDCTLGLTAMLGVSHADCSTPSMCCTALQIQLNVVRWAMIDVLKRPPPGFEEVVREHFRIMRHRCHLTLVMTLPFLCAVHRLYSDI